MLEFGGPVSIFGGSPNIMEFLIAIILYLFCISLQFAVCFVI